MRQSADGKFNGIIFFSLLFWRFCVCLFLSRFMGLFSWFFFLFCWFLSKFSMTQNHFCDEFSTIRAQNGWISRIKFVFYAIIFNEKLPFFWEWARRFYSKMSWLNNCLPEIEKKKTHISIFKKIIFVKKKYFWPKNLKYKKINAFR